MPARTGDPAADLRLACCRRHRPPVQRHDQPPCPEAVRPTVRRRRPAYDVSQPSQHDATGLRLDRRRGSVAMSVLQVRIRRGHLDQVVRGDVQDVVLRCQDARDQSLRQRGDQVIDLRAERTGDRQRTDKPVVADPPPTTCGQDLRREHAQLPLRRKPDRRLAGWGPSIAAALVDQREPARMGAAQRGAADSRLEGEVRHYAGELPAPASVSSTHVASSEEPERGVRGIVSHHQGVTASRLGAGWRRGSRLALWRAGVRGRSRWWRGSGRLGLSRVQWQGYRRVLASGCGWGRPERRRP